MSGARGERGPVVSGAPGGRQGSKLLRQLCATVLVFEAIIIGLAIPVATVLERVHGGIAGGVGGALAVAALVLCGVVGRPGMGWALVAGSVLQVLVIAAGAVVPAMYVLGVIFGALWVTGIWLARRLDRLAAERQAAGGQAAGGQAAEGVAPRG